MEEELCELVRGLLRGVLNRCADSAFSMLSLVASWHVHGTTNSIEGELPSPKRRQVPIDVIQQLLIPSQKPGINVCFRPKALIYCDIFGISPIHPTQNVRIVVCVVGVHEGRIEGHEILRFFTL